MTTNLNINLSPEALTALQQVAIATGRSPSEEAASMLELQLRRCNPNQSNADEHGPRIEDFFGKISFGGSMTNEQIDAELAREYGKGLEGY